jgi:hypothetical protein
LELLENGNASEIEGFASDEEEAVDSIVLKTSITKG